MIVCDNVYMFNVGVLVIDSWSGVGISTVPPPSSDDGAWWIDDGASQPEALSRIVHS